jgi:hypothetical protein
MGLIDRTDGAGRASGCPVPEQPVDRAGTLPADRSLVPLASAADAGRPPVPRRPLAGFLAQLIATAQQAPQTRQRRRGEPDDAAALYLGASRACVRSRPHARTLDRAA